jgi:large conductance mechanosensitive channel protein
VANKATSNETARARAAKAAAAKAAATARANTLRRVELAARTAPGQQVAGFLDFIREQGVVGLAIGLVMGAQVKALVDQIVTTFIDPILGWILPGQGDLSKKTFTLTLHGEPAVFAYGAFIAVLISFLSVAAIIYFGYKLLNLDRLDKKKED